MSPGATDRSIQTSDTCPSFSWTLVEDAERYDLLVLQLQEDDVADRPPTPSPAAASAQETDIALRHQVPGAATTWQPPASDCLVPGRPYAWSVRAERPAGWSEWSDPLRFTSAGSVVGRGAEGRHSARLEPEALRLPARGTEPAAITTPGLVESTVQGFRFPDGSVQTRAFRKTVLHAAVAADGDLIFGDVSSASNTNTGAFQVDIGRPGLGCTATATIAAYDPPELAIIVFGSAVTVVEPGSALIDVYTVSSAGTATNLPFMLQVVCNPIVIFQ